jgi:hypothetical protein
LTPGSFRDLALSLPEAVKGEHMGHPDFRIGGKIFATLSPADGWGMVKLTPAQQARFMREHPAAFAPIPSGWGRRGATRVELKAADRASVKAALLAAWLNTAPKRLLNRLDAGDG